MAEKKLERKTDRKPASMLDDKKPTNKFRKPKRKVCTFCSEKIKTIDYKDTARLKRFMTEKGKIVARRGTGVCAAHQRELTKAIKCARVMALLPFKAE